MIDVIILYGAVDGGRNNWPRRIVIVRRENAFTDPMTFALGGGGRLAHFHFFFFFFSCRSPPRAAREAAARTVLIVRRRTARSRRVSEQTRLVEACTY